MTRSKEFGPGIFQRFEQGSQAREAMFQRAMARTFVNRVALPATIIDTPMQAGIVTRHNSWAIMTMGALGLAVGLNFIVDYPSVADAGNGATSTPTPTRTPTRSVQPRATVVISGEQGINIRIDNSNNNDVTQRLLDALLNPTALPSPVSTPTPKDAQDLLIEAEERIGRMLSKEEVAALLAVQNKRTSERIEGLRNPSPTPNATETRIARATAGAQEIAERQATATAAVPPGVAAAKRRAEQLSKEEEAAELDAENRRTEERIRRLRGEIVPTSVPSGGADTNQEFPWLPLILVTGGLGAIYLLRRRIFPAPTGPAVVAGGPAVPTNIWQRIYILRGPHF